jgi:hypothetical protein
MAVVAGSWSVAKIKVRGAIVTRTFSDPFRNSGWMAI